MFAELHCLSHFSFLRGASSPRQLVEQADALGYRAIALTDECSFAGIVKAHVAAKSLDLSLIIGSEFYVDDGIESKACHVILLASCRQAYSEISLLISKARRRSPKGEYQLSFMDLQFGTRHCLCIWLPKESSSSNTHQLSLLKRFFKQRLWLGVRLSQGLLDDLYYQQCHQLAQQYDVSMVACNQVLAHDRSYQPLQDCLTAIRLNCPITELGRQRQTNSEHYLRPLRRLQQLYPEELLSESLHIAQLCQFSLDELKHDYPKELVPAALTAAQHLRQLSYRGAKIRWPKGIPENIEKQLQHELETITELHYEHYFLTVEDIVRFARQQNILCQGRGSAANSVVCYCLFITEVDPQQSSLLFERFISKERQEPPDIDVDFEHQRREEVIQYIYQKYTRKRTALTATVITYRPRSAIRDLGKALGFDSAIIEQLAKDLTWWDKPQHLQARLQENGIALDSHIAQHFLVLLEQLLGTPRHLSQHVGGFLMTQTPISNLVPVENAAMPDRTIIQWDKEDIESLCLLKVDVLALGMLTAIRKSLALIESYQQSPMSLEMIPKEDPETYDLLCRGDSVGIFQVESRAQMAMLPRLRPRRYYDLVIQVAIVRPGPIQGDMVHPYLKRRNGEEAVRYPNEAVKSVLERTLGIPIFQEQVIKLAMVAAGFSGGQADQLRRAMASWGRNGDLNGFQQQLIDGMLARGHSLEFAQRLFRQMQGFGEYGFPESHAASFALLVYTSSWLKCHHPAAFYCGLLNSLPMGFYSASQLIQDARRHGIQCLPMDVAHSQWDHQLEFPDTNIPDTRAPDTSTTATPSTAKAADATDDIDSPATKKIQPALRLGLRLIKGLSKTHAETIYATRISRPQAFNSLAEFKQHTGLSAQTLEQLAAGNALGSLSEHRYDAHWQVQAIEQPLGLFPSDSFAIDDSASQVAEPSAVETTLADYRYTGLTLNQHPMSLLRQQPMFQRCLRACDLLQVNSGRFVRIAGVVTGRQRPGTASGVLFMTLEDETGNTNVVIWESLQQRRRREVLKSKIVMIKGILERKDNVIHVIAGDIENASELLPEFGQKSRDFH
ncbi:MAG: error-prone DNA polymerase [Cellvibrionaceae bacterium]|nr:error-prone DNA polymerase [Cellvibrionaceae bacterium]